MLLPLLWARGWRQRRRREADSQAKQREEDAAERRQLGRRADGEEKLLEKNSVMASSCTGSRSATVRGLDAPVIEPAD